ncbi:hypothetical protein QQF64_018286 [Cirrhinus molitorella]|uniref:Uncharacterized protein n=1 Tax=Cirrhinus molitorella TaxID=172907 RepID=A0ABR3LC52_9TELE
MIERYLEEQTAVYSAITDKAVKKNCKDIVTLSANDVRLAENVITVLKPLKTLMCTESSPSMVLPMKMMILKSMALSDDDSPAGQATGTTEPATSIETQTVDLEPSTSSPQEKKSAMTELFGGLFMTNDQESVAKMTEEEVQFFRAVDCIACRSTEMVENPRALIPSFCHIDTPLPGCA